VQNSPRVLARLGHYLLIFALLGATGTHWMVLQTVAWSGMLADNLRGGSLSEAVSRTFDGQHPCELCRQIATGKRAEQKSTFVGVKLKLEFVKGSAMTPLQSPRLAGLSALAAIGPHSRLNQPAVPPPRSLCFAS